MSENYIMHGNILVTQGTTALAQRVVSRHLSGWTVSFASSAALPEILRTSGRYAAIPAPDHSTFIHEMLKLALDKELDYILPLDQTEAYLLSGSRVLFHEYGIRVLVPSTDRLQMMEAIQNPPSGMELQLLFQEEEFGAVTAGPGLFCVNDEGEYYLCFAR